VDIRDNKAAIDYLIAKTKSTRDVSCLVKRLREHDRTITGELRDLIAELLEQKYKSRKLTKSHPSATRLKSEIKSWKAMLKGGEAGIAWEKVANALKIAGIIADIDTKGGITEAAEALTAYSNRLSKCQLDELIRPRKTRSKK
jgi:hypothetical protein